MRSISNALGIFDIFEFENPELSLTQNSVPYSKPCQSSGTLPGAHKSDLIPIHLVRHHTPWAPRYHGYEFLALKANLSSNFHGIPRISIGSLISLVLSRNFVKCSNFRCTIPSELNESGGVKSIYYTIFYIFYRQI